MVNALRASALLLTVSGSWLLLLLALGAPVVVAVLVSSVALVAAALAFGVARSSKPGTGRER
jgi:hypothetical protein